MLSAKAQADVADKLQELSERHGGLVKEGVQTVKCDAAYREAYPDAVSLDDWRLAFWKAAEAEQSAEKPVAGEGR